MNFRLIMHIIGQILRAEGVLMIIPLIAALAFGESLWPLLIPLLLAVLVGSLLAWRRPAKDDRMSARDGLFVVGVSWVVLSLFGMLPYLLCGAMASPVDAFFETVSGFTTTGATVLGDALGTFPADLPRGVSLWRALTHWIGGMGVLVLVLAIMPQQQFKSARLMHAMRAEVPGPVATKVVATIRRSAGIVYAIYVGLTLLEMVALLLCGLSFYDALLHAFSTAGTGGFSNMNASIAAFDSSAVHWVLTVFMLLFSVNFNLYYLILIGQGARALLSEELRWFVIIVAATTGIITLNIAATPLYQQLGVGIALRDAAFNVAAFVSTTGFTTAAYDSWPYLSQLLLAILMFVGGCTGSTCGGLKLGRLLILVKSSIRELRYTLRPREVRPVRAEGKAVEEDTVRGVNAYFALFFLLFAISIVALMLLDEVDLLTAFSAIATCINNVGPAFGEVIGFAAGGSFGVFSVGAKLLLSFVMLLGRLELFPILILFMPKTWSKK